MVGLHLAIAINPRLAQILHLFAKDSWRRVYAGQLEVRPPAAPIIAGAAGSWRPLKEGPQWTVGYLRSCTDCQQLIQQDRASRSAARRAD
jgi:hypothetical protein